MQITYGLDLKADNDNAIHNRFALTVYPTQGIIMIV